ncbi:MAG: hypothetical protein Q8927_04780 [Bacteroidota bacterium]|nr:hypothetical protein [Bacteroidota bacterium]MDP4215493.1 hypothetical protein [Bacteroidota bacterium]MDP4247396.1 hypothetical protein [Bacteroidota bacterium]MDP4252550.1 hypothetical protein [Bacteroidota bacterium]MDP4257814.1 hypothetical protein [Bacteroidota bacterium]
MRFLLISILVIAGFALVFLGCSKTSADRLSGYTPCDTTAVSYTRDILPIIQQYCYPCHGNGRGAFGAGINLESKDTGYDEMQGWGMNGYLIGNVTHASGYIGMPYGKPMLDSCEINKIIAWVNQNYPR